MSRRAGFTLVEVMVGIVITSVVALLVYGAVRTAADTQARLDDGRVAAQGEMAWRSTVADAVRGVRSGRDYDEPTLLLQDGVDREGRPADRLVMVTTADAPPLATGADWRISIGAEAGGLVAEATPLGRWRAATRTFRAPTDLTGMDVQALVGGSWVGAWSGGPSLPRALRITFWTRDGPTGVPLVLTIPLGGAP